MAGPFNPAASRPLVPPSSPHCQPPYCHLRASDPPFSPCPGQARPLPSSHCPRSLHSPRLHAPCAPPHTHAPRHATPPPLSQKRAWPAVASKSAAREPHHPVLHLDLALWGRAVTGSRPFLAAPGFLSSRPGLHRAHTHLAAGRLAEASPAAAPIPLPQPHSRPRCIGAHGDRRAFRGPPAPLTPPWKLNRNRPWMHQFLPRGRRPPHRGGQSPAPAPSPSAAQRCVMPPKTSPRPPGGPRRLPAPMQASRCCQLGWRWRRGWRYVRPITRTPCPSDWRCATRCRRPLSPLLGSGPLFAEAHACRVLLPAFWLGGRPTLVPLSAGSAIAPLRLSSAAAPAALERANTVRPGPPACCNCW